MSRILVTGGAGFIGSHLMDRLADQGRAAVCLDNFNDFYDPGLKRMNMSGYMDKPDVEVVEGDIRDVDLLERVFSDTRPTQVVHLAAMAGVRPSLLDNPELPILADNNPCFDDGRPLFDALTRLGMHDPAKSNSRAHRGTGQNVLTLDGRVIWKTTPNSGVNGDNIWTLEKISDYNGREGPESKTDSHLLK